MVLFPFSQAKFCPIGKILLFWPNRALLAKSRRRQTFTLLRARGSSNTELRHSSHGPDSLGIKEVDDAIWLVSFMHYDLGYIDLEQKTLQTIDNPFGTRLSPMS